VDENVVNNKHVTFLDSYLHANVKNPFTPIDNIQAMMIVWMIKEKILRTALCSIV